MNEELQKKMQEFIDSAGTKITELQAKVKDLGEQSPDFKAFEEKIRVDLKKDLDEIQNIKSKLDGMDEERKNIEALIAKGMSAGTQDKNEIKSSPEALNAFYSMLKSGAVTATPKELREKNAEDLMDAFMPHLTDDERVYAKTMLVGSNPNGGFLVPATVSAKIYQRMFETSPMRQIANVVKIIGDRFIFPIDDGEIECDWIDEVTTRADTNASELGEGEIPAMEIYAKPKISQKLLEDASVSIDTWLTNKATQAFNRKANTAFVTGNGVKRPRGFLDYDTTALEYEKGKIQAVDTAGSAIAVDDLLNLYAKLFDQYMTADARFVMSKEIFIDLCKLKESTSGAYLINPRLLFEGFKPQILGIPIQYLQDMPKTQAANAKAIALGNFKEGYTIVDRLGMSIVNDNITSVGFLKMNFRMRLGGGLTNSQAIKLLKIRA